MKDVIMSRDHLKLYHLALKVIEGDLMLKDFAILTGLSKRQAIRRVKKVKEMDYIGALHGNTGNIPVNKISSKLEEVVVHLLRTKYQGFNLTHFREMLLFEEKIEIKKTTLQMLAKKHGLEKHSRRPRKRVHKPRPRLPQEGMLVQYDGSAHRWFGGITSHLLLGIDDATGKILAAEFFEGETTFNGLKIIRDIVDEYGIPLAFYFDQAAAYGRKDRDWNTNIGRAFQTLNCKLILAGSPQAKGRVERLFRTLQDRLVSELSLRKIRTMDEANEYLQKHFIHLFNKQFSVEPENPTKAYMPNVFGDLDIILCKKEQRKVLSGNIFSLEGHHYQINDKMNLHHRLVNINTHLDGTRSFDIMGRSIIVTKLERNYRYLKAG
jgi:transposase